MNGSKWGQNGHCQNKVLWSTSHYGQNMGAKRTLWAHYGNANVCAHTCIIQKINLFKFCKYLKSGANPLYAKKFLGKIYVFLKMGGTLNYSSSCSANDGGGPIKFPCLCSSIRAFLSPSGPMSSKSYIRDS